MIHKLRDMIGVAGVQTSIWREMPNGNLRSGWVRAVPSPFYGGVIDRLHDAWAVLTGRAVAVKWPLPGELEDALTPAQPEPPSGSRVAGGPEG